MARSRRKSRRRHLCQAFRVEVIACAIGLLAVFTPDADAASSNPATVALASGNQQRAVHWIGTTITSDAKFSVNTDAGTTYGRQSVIISSSGSFAEVNELLVHHTAYVEGNALGLYAVLSMTTAASSKEAGRWIAISDSSPQFVAVADGLTVSSTLAEFAMTGKTTLFGQKKVLGEQALEIAGTSVAFLGAPSAKETLYVGVSGHHLPIEALQTSSTGDSTTDFWSWGERFSVRAPKHSVTFKTGWLQKL